jgi:hypothetical protein
MHEALSGRDSTGSFRTAHGKIYPAGLNKALAGAIVSYVEDTFDGSTHQTLPHDFCDLIVNDFVSDDTVQPDFYG